MTRSLGPAVFLTVGALFGAQVGGRATRDALFLSSYPFAALPAMIMVTAVFALALAYYSTRFMVRWGPERVMPAAFAASAALLVAEWGLSFLAPRAAAAVVYLHFGGMGALLISGFWSFLSERLDPRSAKRQLGQITAVGTLGGMAGGLAADQLARILPVAAMLPVLAIVQLVCAWGMIRLGSVGQGAGSGAVGQWPSVPGHGPSAPGHGPSAPPRGPIVDPATEAVGAIGVLTSIPYIRRLAVLVVVITMADVMVDLVMKSRAMAAIPDAGGLLQFFAAFYTGVSVFTFLLQAFVSRFVLERLGPARSASILPVGTVVTAAGALVVPGVSSAVVARGTQSVLMNTLFGAGYEVLFTPVPARDKRAVKSLVDVGGSRAGDLLGAGVAQAIVLVALPAQGTLLLILAIGLSVTAFLLAQRMQRGYVDALARGLVTRAVHLEISEATDTITRSTLLKTLGIPRSRSPLSGTLTLPADTGTLPSGQLSRTQALGPAGLAPSAEAPAPESEESKRARAIDSRDPAIVRRALAEGPLPESLLPRVVPLLGWDPVARDAIAALRLAGSAAVEPLALALLDPHAEFTIRRRAPLVLGTIPDRRVVDALAPPLFDARFEVRYRAGHALAHVQTADPTLPIPRELVFAAVLREVETATGVWESRILLDQMDDDAWSPVMDELVRDRANRSLEHVFTLLALVLPRKPLRIAFRGLLTDDPLLRGTALEYLETTLPPEIRKPLWPYLEPERARRPTRAAGAKRGEAVDELLRMNESIVIKLEELRGKE